MANNVEVLNGFYVPEEDFLIPGKPNIDWGLQAPSDNTAVSFAGGLLDQNTGNMSGMQMPELDLAPQRKRRAGSNIAALGLVDIIEGLSGDPNAYIGRSMARANAFDEERSKEDPEGYQIDLNRAKVLSQKAYQETDPVKKAIYGREIKKLLPRETQGLDDVTAADMFTSNEKVELERLKQAGRMQLQEAKNQGAYSIATLKTMSAEQINREKLEARWDIEKLKAEYNKAIQEGKNDTALTIQEMITDRQYDLHMMDNAAKLKQTEMQQLGATQRTVMQQEGAMSRTLANNASREDIERIKADIAREQIAGRERVAQISAEARKAATAAKAGQSEGQLASLEAKTSPELLAKMKRLNTSAGRWDYLGDPEGMNIWQRTVPGSTYAVSVQNAEQTAKDYQEFEGLAKQIVQDQLKKIYGSQFTQKEGEAFFESMGLNPKMAPDVRWTLFMNAINNVRRNAGLPPMGNGTNLSPVKSGSTGKIKSVKRIG